MRFNDLRSNDLRFNGSGGPRMRGDRRFGLRRPFRHRRVSMCRHFRLRCRQRHFNRLCRSGLPRVNRRVSRRLGDRWRREFKLALRVGDAMLRVDVMHLIDVMLFIGAMQLIRSAGGRAVGL